MTSFRAVDGYLSLGGRLVATAGPLVNGALTAAATSMNIDGTNLDGVVVAGDTFTLAGESGSPVHTVTGGPFFVAAADAIAGITFTPAIATGGVGDNAAATFVSNSIAEAKLWDLNIRGGELDATKFGDAYELTELGLVTWTGRGEAWLDYGDAKQKSLVDRLTGATPSTANVEGVLFGVIARKQFYAGAELTAIEVAGGDVNGLQRIVFTFRGRGAFSMDWQS